MLSFCHFVYFAFASSIFVMGKARNKDSDDPFKKVLIFVQTGESEFTRVDIFLQVTGVRSLEWTDSDNTIGVRSLK